MLRDKAKSKVANTSTQWYRGGVRDKIKRGAEFRSTNAPKISEHERTELSSGWFVVLDLIKLGDIKQRDYRPWNGRTLVLPKRMRLADAPGFLPPGGKTLEKDGELVLWMRPHFCFFVHVKNQVSFESRL